MANFRKRFDGHYKITTSSTDPNVTITTHTLTVNGNQLLLVQQLVLKLQIPNSIMLLN